MQHIENTFQCAVEMCENKKGGIKGGFIEKDECTLKWVGFFTQNDHFYRVPFLEHL